MAVTSKYILDFSVFLNVLMLYRKAYGMSKGL